MNSISIDKYFSNKNILSLDLFKIDTEGTEHTVLEGGSKLIKKFEPAIICEVLPGFTENKLHDFFKDLNYKYYRITKNGLLAKNVIEGDSTYEYKNYLFITDKRLKSNLSDIKILSDQ